MSSIILKGPAGGNVRMLVDPELTEDEEMILPFNSVPLFGVIMYFGLMAELDPEIWALCDGTQGTPNLINQFVRGGDGLNTGVVGGSDDAIVVTHTHSSPVHSHTIDSHTHTGAAHTHAGPAHTHAGPSHNHTSDDHTHSINHNHASFTCGNNNSDHDHSGLGTTTWWQTNSSAGSGWTIIDSGTPNTTGNNNSDHAHSIDVPDYSGTSGSTTPDATGYSGTGSTDSSGTQDTGAASAGDTGGTSLETNQGGAVSDPNVGDTGVDGTGLNMPAFTTLVYIMRIK